MIVRRFFEPAIAQSSYLVGCSAAGKAIVFDPNRDVDQYVRAAADAGLRIAYVTETHIHADFVSGARELAKRTGATLLLSDEGDADWKYAFADEGRLVRHGDAVTVGNVRVDILHTPGHTPEHLTFLITDGAVADVPMAAVTGDFVFCGDVGRPDLLERAANMAGTMEKGARVLFRSLEQFKRQEDWLQIWPGHGAGSACGKGISAVPHSTLGYERRFNWAFKVGGEQEFVSSVLAGQPEPPKYFATMKRVNKEGPPLLGGFHVPPRMDDAALPALVAGGATVVDARPAAEHAAGFVPGTLNIPLNASFVTWAGWLVPYDVDLYLVLPEGAESRLEEVARALALIGLDRIAGYFGAGAVAAWARQTSQPLGTTESVTAPALVAELHGEAPPVVVDVRSQAEWNDGRIDGAVHIPLGYLADRLAEVPRDRRVVVQCAAGARSAIGCSVLARAGYTNMVNLEGGFDAVRQLQSPRA
ncbi:MAG: rhodanese-like domain-containing protein [Acidobacteriota bacterium]